MKLEVDLVFHHENKHEQVETFNLKNKECQSKFHQLGSQDQRFASDDESIHIQFKRWQRIFCKAIYACFRKIRLGNNVNSKSSPIDELMNEKKNIMKKSQLNTEDLKKIDKIEQKITKDIEEKEFEKIKMFLVT